MSMKLSFLRKSFEEGRYAAAPKRLMRWNKKEGRYRHDSVQRDFATWCSMANTIGLVDMMHLVKSMIHHAKTNYHLTPELEQEAIGIEAFIDEALAP